MIKFRKITDRLYECLAGENRCKHRVPFGDKTFCSWLLRSEENRTSDNFPCPSKEKDTPH